MCAHVPVPVGRRSDRPGATMHVSRLTSPIPSKGHASWTSETPRISGFWGVDGLQLLESGRADLLATGGKLASFGGIQGGTQLR
jgi:hypothetical protein